MTTPPDGRTLAAGAAWIGLFRWTAQLLSWAAMLVVLRLLQPADFGIANLALAIVAIAAVVSEFGLGTAVVVLPTLEDAVARQLHGAAILLGLAAGALFALASHPIAAFYDEPALTPVIRVLGLVFVAEGLRLVPLGLLARRLAYRTTAGLDFLRAVLTAGTVLTLAWAGTGYWALVLGNLAGTALTAVVISARFGIRPALPRAADLRAPMRYAWHLFVSRGAWVLYRTSDVLVAGRLVSATLLGYYSMASTLASLPGEKLGNVITAATAPFFAAIQSDRARLRHWFLRVTEVLALMLYPVMFGFLAVADLAVPLVLGDQWLSAVPVVRILFGFAAIHAVTTPVSQVLNVTGHTRENMLAGIIALGVMPAAFVTGGLLAGIHGIALAWLVCYPVVLLYPVRIALRALELDAADFLRCGRRAAEGVAAMLVTVAALRWGLGPQLGPWAELAASVGAGASGYLGLLWWRHRAMLLAIPALLRGRGAPGAAVAT